MDDAKADPTASYIIENTPNAAPAHRHDLVELLVPLSAKCLLIRHVTASGTTREFAHAEGSMYLIDAQQLHSAKWDRLEMVVIRFSKDVLQRVAHDAFARPMTIATWYGFHDTFLYQLAVTMREHHVDHAHFSRLYIESHTYVAAARLVERIARRDFTEPVVEVRDRRMRAACEYIDERIGEDLSLETLAASVGLSTYHFLRTFNAAVGVTPHRYVVERRLLHARRRLEHSEHSVSHIASELGFATASHFTSAFRQRFGHTPGDLREKTIPN